MTRGVRNRAAAVVVTLVALVGVMSGCSAGGSISATATFDDVSDLQGRAPVLMSDVQVGEVSSVELAEDGRRAKVTISVKEDANVPADVRAEVRRTTPIGEDIVALVPLTNDPEAPPLENGAVIDDATRVPDLEQLVSSGEDLFATLSAQQISILLEEGATALEGRGPVLNEVIANLDTIIAGFNSRTDTIRALVTDIDLLAAELAPESSQAGRVLDQIRETTEILQVNADQFLDTLLAVNELADQTSSLIRDHFDNIRLQFDALRSLTNAVASEQAALAGILENVPLTPDLLGAVTYDRDPNFGNVIADAILCGLPEAIGGEIPGDPLNGCDGPGNPP